MTSHVDELQSEREEMEQALRGLEADKIRLLDRCTCTFTKYSEDTDVTSAVCRCAELNEKQRELEEAEVTLTSPVAERNGPLQVATEYDVLMSNTWQDAKSALDQYSDWKVKEKDKYEILTSTLLVRSHCHTTSTP